MNRSDGGCVLSFEIGGCAYGLPVEAVLEVAELGKACGVPTLPSESFAVVNWNGEALPMIAPRLLLEADGEAEGPIVSWREAEQFLVLSGQDEEIPWLGLPVDAVLEMVASPSGEPDGAVAECRSKDGRRVNVLDPHRLVERARQVIEELAA